MTADNVRDLLLKQLHEGPSKFSGCGAASVVLYTVRHQHALRSLARYSHCSLTRRRFQILADELHRIVLEHLLFMSYGSP